MLSAFRTWAESSAEIAAVAKTLDGDAGYDYVAKQAGPAFDAAYKPLNAMTDEAIKAGRYTETMGEIESAYRAVAKRLEK